MGKVHISLACASKVRGSTPKAAKQEKKKKPKGEFNIIAGLKKKNLFKLKPKLAWGQSRVRKKMWKVTLQMQI